MLVTLGRPRRASAKSYTVDKTVSSACTTST
jgi:hypothetical protein